MSATPYPHLFSPLEIGGFTVRNRIVNTTHGTTLSETRELDYLRRRAEGGAGMLGVAGLFGVANYFVGPGSESRRPDWDQNHPSPITPEGIRYYDEEAVARMRRRAEVIHAAGARCYAQVAHMGAGLHYPSLAPAIGPSPVADPYEANSPHQLSEDEIEEVIGVFARGIRRVRDAGFDAVEVHGGHGYLVCQFLSSYTNRRDDEWGGGLVNRVRLLRRILTAARELVDDFPIGVRS